MMISQQDYQDFLQNPAEHFPDPNAVVENKALDNMQKMKILKAWKADEQELQTATSENMMGGNTDILDKVVKAITKLESVQKD